MLSRHVQCRPLPEAELDELQFYWSQFPRQNPQHEELLFILSQNTYHPYHLLAVLTSLSALAVLTMSADPSPYKLSRGGRPNEHGEEISETCQEVGYVVALALDDLLEAAGRGEEQPCTHALVHQISCEITPRAPH